jgi:glucokinase
VSDKPMTPLSPASRPVLALDLGGTQLRTALVMPGGRLLGRRTQPTPRADAEALVAACAAQMRATLAAAAESERATDAPARSTGPVAIAISAPGPLDPFAGIFLDPPNLDLSLRGFPFAARLGEELDLPAVMERDTQMAVLAEGEFGAARGMTDYVYVTVSTGIGGGVVSGGRLLRGANGLANELGHLTIDINGPVCGCGATGHLEAIASGTGIARAAREAGLGDIGASEVAARADQGNQDAVRIMERARQAFAAAAVSIVDVFNPQRIIVGGGIAIGQGDRLLQPARDAVHTYAFKRQAQVVEIVPSMLGDDVGLVGALPLVRLALLGDDGNYTSARPRAAKATA